MLPFKLKNIFASLVLLAGWPAFAASECGSGIAHAKTPLLIAADASPQAFFTVLANATGGFYQLRDGSSGFARSYLPSVQLSALPFAWQAEWGAPRQMAVQSLGKKVYEGVGLVAVSTANERLGIGSSLNGRWHWIQETGPTIRSLAFLALGPNQSRLFVLGENKLNAYDIHWKGRDEIWVGREQTIAENFGSYDFLSVIDESTCYLASELGHYVVLNQGVVTRSEKIGAWLSAFAARPTPEGTALMWVGGDGTLISKMPTTDPQPLVTLAPNVVARSLAFARLPSAHSFGRDWMEGLVSRFVTNGEAGSYLERVLVLGSDGYLTSPWSQNQTKAVRISTAETEESNGITTVDEEPLWPYARALGITIEDWGVIKNSFQHLPTGYARQASLRMWLDHHSFELAKQHHAALGRTLAQFGSTEEQWMLLDHLTPGTRNSLLEQRQLTARQEQEIADVRNSLSFAGPIGVEQRRLIEVTAFHYGMPPNDFVFAFQLWLAHQDPRALIRETLGSKIARFLSGRTRSEVILPSLR